MSALRAVKRPLFPARPHAWRGLVLVLCALTALAGCAEGVPTTAYDDGADQGAGDMAADMPTTREDLGVEDMPIAKDMPVEGDMAVDGDMGAADMGVASLSVCQVARDVAPWDACESVEEGVSFGVVGPGQMVTRVVRLDSDGGQPVTIEALELFLEAASPVVITTATMTRATPPVRQEVTLPHVIAPGEALFVELTVAGGLEATTLEDLLTVKATLDGAAREERVKLNGVLGGCAVGTQSCDEDLSNGCETDIYNNTSHCGACGEVCDLLNAQPRCSQGACQIERCDEDYLKSCDGRDDTGCEVDTRTRLDHCGDCGQLCARNNATMACQGGQCNFQGCNGTWADCDSDIDAQGSNGCESNLANDAAHCGVCGRSCGLPNAQMECNVGQCRFVRCATGYYNLDNDLNTNGCEYQCNFISNNDPPDDVTFTDANCDGIDGEASSGLFVAIDGSDTLGIGSRLAPYRTISKALSVARVSSGIKTIFVSEGTYDEQLFMVDGVSIVGGYQRSQGWARSAQAVSRVRWGTAVLGRVVAVHAANIGSPTLLDRMTIEAQSTTVTNTSVYGLHCVGCGALTIRRSTITAGSAGDGADGSDGTDGLGGQNGSPGNSGSCDGSGWGSGGSGGFSPCGRTGGSGGRGGSEGKNSGSMGGTGFQGISGGGGGSGGDPGRDGSNGSTGTGGTIGSNGAGGSGGGVSGDFWEGARGVTGTDGADGNGGGGGGGGGGQGCTFCNNGAGNGGGGGGGGGCGGTGATGGHAGGSSFGVFLFNSNGITLSRNTFSSGGGGDGGAGGRGGSGGSGGSGGAGNTHCTSEIGEGGDGGRGGSGGRGGHGGGGAGGNSWPIYRENTSVGLPGTNTLQAGQPGSGGTSPGSFGIAGVTAPFR